MALARVLEIIAFLIYIQESRGQFNNLINNPTLGQNNLNQGFQSATNIKSVTDNLFQKESLGKNTNFNSQKQVNIQQSSIPQSSLPPTQPFSLQQSQNFPTQPFPLQQSQNFPSQPFPLQQSQNFPTQPFPLQQSQNFPQLTNQQSSQTSNLQQPLLHQPETSFVQHSTVPQQPYNYLESSTLKPVNNAGNINYRQQTGTPTIQSVPIQVSQSIPLSNTYVPAYYSITPVTSGGGQPMEFVNNLGSNYLVPLSTLPSSTSEGQIVSSYSTLPYTMLLSAPYPTMLENNVVMPYPNQIFDIYDDPLDYFSETALADEVASLTSDKIATLLVSLLQTPKNSSKYTQSYTPYNGYQDTKSSSLKSLLPIILNLIKEKREGCGCNSCCNCHRRNRNKKDSASEIIEDYSTKRKNSLKEEMFRTHDTEADIPRMIRKCKNHNKIKNPVPDISIESIENEDLDYDHSSEEDDD